MEVAAAVDALFANITNITNLPDSFADDFNTLYGTLFSSVSYMCANGCETCYNGTCGLLESTREDSISFRKSNFTTDQILNRQIDETLFANYTFLLMNCVQYTSGASLDGKLCLGVDIDNPANTQNAQQMCVIEYGGVACNSCVIDFQSRMGCYTADCTNIDASAMIDSCSGTGFVGPFIFLDLLRTDVNATTDLTVGSCDGQSAPVAPTGPPPTESPVAVPVSVPTAPVSAPTAAVNETSAPVTKPTAPVASPAAPVKAPSAPVKAPSAPVKAPAAPTTSGSAGMGVAWKLWVVGFLTTATYFIM
jgi:hypothetical protein